MKVDEFITIYKLLGDQTWYSILFTLVATFGFVWLLIAILKKESIQQLNPKQLIVYFACLGASSVILIMHKNQAEELRKDALVLKKYIETNRDNWREGEVKNIEKYFSNSPYKRMDSTRIMEIVAYFPNDFDVYATALSPLKKNILGKYYIDEIKKIKFINLNTAENLKRIRKLCFVKLNGLLVKGVPVDMDSIMAFDNRLTLGIQEETCIEYPDKFALTKINGSNKSAILKLKD